MMRFLLRKPKKKEEIAGCLFVEIPHYMRKPFEGITPSPLEQSVQLDFYILFFIWQKRLIEKLQEKMEIPFYIFLKPFPRAYLVKPDQLLPNPLKTHIQKVFFQKGKNFKDRIRHALKKLSSKYKRILWWDLYTPILERFLQEAIEEKKNYITSDQRKNIAFLSIYSESFPLHSLRNLPQERNFIPFVRYLQEKDIPYRISRIIPHYYSLKDMIRISDFLNRYKEDQDALEKLLQLGEFFQRKEEELRKKEKLL